MNTEEINQVVVSDYNEVDVENVSHFSRETGFPIFSRSPHLQAFFEDVFSIKLKSVYASSQFRGGRENVYTDEKTIDVCDFVDLDNTEVVIFFMNGTNLHFSCVEWLVLNKGNAK